MADRYKKMYEHARAEVLAEMGKKNVGSMTDSEVSEYKIRIKAKIREMESTGPDLSSAMTGRKFEEESVVYTDTDTVIKTAPAPTIESSAAFGERMKEMERIEAEVPIVPKAPLIPMGLKPPIIDSLELIELFQFVVYKGYAGVGKTASVISYAINNGYDVFSFVCSEDMGLPDLVGSYIIRGGDVVYNQSQILAAVRNSNRKKTLLILDEINLLRPAVLKSLNDLLDFRKELSTDIGKFYGKDLKIVGLMNLEAESMGNDLDVSVQSRAFVHEVDIKFVTTMLLKGGVVNDKMVEVMQKTRFAFGLREAEQLNILKNSGVKNPVDMLLQKYADESQRQQIAEAFKAVYGSLYNEHIKGE